jgi:hypothetical protein
VVHRTYEIGGEIIGIRTTSQRFGEWLDYALAEYRVDTEGEWTFSIVVPEKRDGEERGRRRLNILYWDTSAVSRTLDLTELARTLLAQLEVFLMSERDDAVYLGASLVAVNGSKVLIPSQVGFYLHRRVQRRAERAGVPLPMEPYVAVEPGSGRLLPFRPILRIPNDALERLDAMSEGAGHPPRTTIRQPSEVDVVWTVGSSVDRILEPLSRGRTLHNLAGAAVNLHRLGGGAVLQSLIPMVQRAECYGVIPFGQPQIVQALAGSLGLNGSRPPSEWANHAYRSEDDSSERAGRSSEA